MFANTAAEINQAATQWQKLMVDTWSQWTANTVASESFAAASGAYMDWTLSTQKMMAQMTGQAMEALDMPRRSDLARLASQVQSVETRLLDQEETSEEIRDLLVALNAKLDRIGANRPGETAVANPLRQTGNAEAASGATSDAASDAFGEAQVAPDGKSSASTHPKTGRKPAKRGKKS
jgi:hypothetical protein